MIPMELDTVFALALATGPTPAIVVAGLVIGTKGVTVDDPEGADVIEALPVVEDGWAADEVEAGEAVCELVAGPEVEDPEARTPVPEELLAEELSGQ